MTYNTDCKWFSGYKPCKFKRKCEACPEYQQIETRICIVSLEAMGAVLRSTCLLPAIRRKYKNAHITWITYKNAVPLLQNNPEIDRLIYVSAETNALYSHLKFDVLFAVDKSMEAGALAESIQSNIKFGFGLNTWGGIKPFTEDAQYQFDIGLDDELKFRINQKPETQQITESMGMRWERDPYILHLTESEKAQSAEWRKQINPNGERVIGYNTGCSLLYPNKKMTIEKSIEIIAEWRANFPSDIVALYGGPEDEERQAAMKAAFAHDVNVVNTPTRGGLRNGIVWMNTADLILSGCSLGMHIAIGLQKKVIAWFGVSCIQEVDLYEKGIKIQSPISCSPCWKKQCDVETKCYDKMTVSSIIDATSRLFE